MVNADDIKEHPELAEHQPWMPGWQHAPGDTVTINHDITTPIADGIATTISSTSTTTQSVHMTSVVNGAGIPVLMTASANAVSSTMLGGGHASLGVGSLGMITVMIMVYNVCAGLGLGVMLWNGRIDWKGNVNEPITSTNAVDTTEGEDEDDTDSTLAQMAIIATDNEGNEWCIPVSWIEAAAQRYIADLHTTESANGTVALNADIGHRGRFELDVLLDVATSAHQARLI